MILKENIVLVWTRFIIKLVAKPPRGLKGANKMFFFSIWSSAYQIFFSPLFEALQRRTMSVQQLVRSFGTNTDKHNETFSLFVTDALFMDIIDIVYFRFFIR